MLKNSRLACFLLFALFSSAASVRGDELTDGFRSPPDAARPHTWWHWVSGTVRGFYRDIQVIAFPALAGERVKVADLKPKVTTSDGATVEGANLFDGDVKTSVSAKPAGSGGAVWIQIEFPQPVQASSMII